MLPTVLPGTLAHRFCLIAEALTRHAGIHMPRRHAFLVGVLWSWLQRAMIRFTRLAGRVAAGRPVRPGGRPGRRNPDLPPRRYLPRGDAWLVRICPGSAVFGSQLRHLLDTPEMAALLAAAPEAGRLMAPLCRMLAIDPPPAAHRAATPSAPPVPARAASSTPAEPRPRRSPPRPRRAVGDVAPAPRDFATA